MNYNVLFSHGHFSSLCTLQRIWYETRQERQICWWTTAPFAAILCVCVCLHFLRNTLLANMFWSHRWKKKCFFRKRNKEKLHKCECQRDFITGSSCWWEWAERRKFPEVLTSLKIPLQLIVFYLLESVVLSCMPHYRAIPKLLLVHLVWQGGGLRVY